MKRLILITDAFPFGKGEKSFIIPELRYLKKEYKVTILSRAPMELIEDKESTISLDDDIELLHCPEFELKKSEKWSYIIKALLSKEFREEISAIIHEKKDILCVKETYFFWVKAVLFWKWMRHQGLFENLDDTLFYSYWANYCVLSLAMEKRNNCSLRFVSRAHGYDLYNERCKGGRQPFKRYTDRWIDKMIFIASVGYEYYLNSFANNICNEEKYTICRLGVQKAIKFPDKKEGDSFRIVSCSTVSQLKRVDLIVKALAILDINCEWHHFGDGREMKNLKELAVRMLDRKTNVEYVLHGNVANEDIMSFYQNNWVDCFITTSSSEGCPVSIQEALSYGIPIIGTDVGEIKYMIVDNGVLLSANPSEQEVSDAIRDIFEKNKISSDSMRAKSLFIWERHFQLEKNVKEFMDVLASL